MMKQVFPGAKEVFEWIFLSVAIFFLLVLIPVWTTPGDDLFFQLSITPPAVLVLMGVLSAANALIIMMQLYIRRNVKQQRKLHAKATEGATAIGIILGTFAATLACAACYSSLLALFGLGTTAFFVEYRVWIATATLVLSAIAIYYSAKRIQNHCEACVVPKRK